MAPRFEAIQSGIEHFRYWTIQDTVSARVTAIAFTETDAESITTKLNDPASADCAKCRQNPRLRQLMAMELADFRLKLEHENGGPLVDDPNLALLLADICDFFMFSTGELAMVLGADLLVYLNTLDNPAVVEELILI
jgi:hypothetical protein